MPEAGGGWRAGLGDAEFEFEFGLGLARSADALVEHVGECALVHVGSNESRLVRDSRGHFREA